MISVLVPYVLRAAVRDKLIIAMVLALGVGTSLAIFMGSSALIEQSQFASVFAGAGLRSVIVLGLVLFVVFHIRRSFDSRDVEFLLSRPVSRAGFLAGFSVAFSLMATTAGLAAGVCLYLLGPEQFGAGHLLWIFSLIIENIVMVNVALFFAMTLSSSASAALATFGFYVLARMMGQILGIIDGHIATPSALTKMMQVISSVMPRLDLMGQTTWLVYGPDETSSYVSLAVQGGVFAALILMASLLDLSRRKF